MIETARNTQLLIAERIFNYYLQIIAIKKEQKVETFIIDVVYADHKASLVHLEDKYDGKSTWRKNIDVKDEDNWNTLPGSFRDAFDDSADSFYVDTEAILEKVSLMLSKKGIANYFDASKEGQSLFTSYPNAKALHVVV